MEILSKCDTDMPSKEILEVSAYLIETRVAFVRSEKIKQISKIIHYSLKNQAFQSYYSHSCFRGRHFAPLYPACLISLLHPRSTTCLCLFTYQKHMVE